MCDYHGYILFCPESWRQCFLRLRRRVRICIDMDDVFILAVRRGATL